MSPKAVVGSDSLVLTVTSRWMLSYSLSFGVVHTTKFSLNTCTCSASSTYSMELSAPLRVPQLLLRVEKLSSKRTVPGLLIAVVATGGGTSVGGMRLAISVGSEVGVSVAGLRNASLFQFALRRAMPATEKRRHTTARQPMIQGVDLQGLDAV